MNEIYWITRLDAICNFLTTISILSFVISVIIFAFAMSNRFAVDDYEEGGEHYNCYMQRFKIFLKYFKRSIIVTLFFIGLLSKSDANIHPEGSAPWKLHIDIYNKYLYWSKRCAIILCISAFINFFIPTTN